MIRENILCNLFLYTRMYKKITILTDDLTKTSEHILYILVHYNQFLASEKKLKKPIEHIVQCF